MYLLSRLGIALRARCPSCPSLVTLSGAGTEGTWDRYSLSASEDGLLQAVAPDVSTSRNIEFKFKQNASHPRHPGATAIVRPGEGENLGH